VAKKETGKKFERLPLLGSDYLEFPQDFVHVHISKMEGIIKYRTGQQRKSVFAHLMTSIENQVT